MQLYAVDSQGALVHARRSLKSTNYSCLECGQIVRLRGGPHRQRHFYHLDPTPLCRQHQKGAIHLHLQAHFLQHLPEADCRLEYRFPMINRRIGNSRPFSILFTNPHQFSKTSFFENSRSDLMNLTPRRDLEKMNTIYGCRMIEKDMGVFHCSI